MKSNKKTKKKVKCEPFILEANVDKKMDVDMEVKASGSMTEED